MPEIGKKLNELRVCDLKDELEKRDLETVGSKAALLERLQMALKSEGVDPNTYVFQPIAKTIKKSQIKPVDQVPIKEEPVDYDGSGVEEEEANGEYRHGDDHLIDEVGTVDDECVIIEDDDEYYDNGGDEPVEPAEDDEEEEEAEGEEAEGEEVENEENTGDGTNQDNEESINLTIGEEEQQLLHDEAPDDKDKSTADEKPKAVRKESNGKADGEGTSEKLGKDDKKEGKDDDNSKNKSKKDEQCNDKKDDSEQKTSSKTSHKDDKEKSAAASSSAATTNATGEASKSTSGAKTASPSRNLWVSGLSSLTRASDLKTIFSKYGKVIGAKVVTNTRTPGTRCYGYVTMSSSNDASRCIEHLHRTELHGRIISVERTKNEIGGNASSASNAGNRSANNTNSSSKKRDDDKRTLKTSSDDKKKVDDKKSSTHGSKKDDNRRDDKSKKDEKDKENKTDPKEAGKDKDDKDREVTSSGKRHSRRGSRSVDGSRLDRNRDHDREREQRQKERERERERIRQREILSYQKIREERERQRLREKERELREEERRRREIRERQRQEEQRLADERKKLAVERERLEKEKAELLRLERERQKLEREKIELERLELKRQQMKIIQSRDDPIKRTVKRSADDRYTEVPDRKRTSGNEGRFEAPPPPRFDAALVTSRSYDKKREDYTSSTTAKRGIDDYTTSKRSDYASKRDDYASSTTKRAAADDYAPAPPKRSTDDYSKRTTGDYIASSGSKRGIDDYSSSNKRDDYSSSKLQRDDYKREVEIRHITASSTSGGGSSYMHKGSGSRYAEPDVQVRSSVTSFRRVDDRGDTRSATGSKRYDGYGGGSNGTWAPSTSSHLSHVSGGGVPTIKSYVSNGMSSNVHSGSAVWQKSSGTTESNWRPMTSSQDRYDRTYNERSGGYADSSRPSGGGLYGSGRPTSDRYGGTVSSRYDGKY